MGEAVGANFMGREGWCILRTRGRNAHSDTLSLSASLAEDGFDVWAPAKTEKIKGREVVRPILAGFVFARSWHLVDLLELALMPVKPRRGHNLLKPAHRNFVVMRCGGRIALADDAGLEELRKAERRYTKPVWAQRAFRKGERVRAQRGTGGFEGLFGFVERSDKRATLVCFGGLFGRVEIPTSLLSGDGLDGLQSATDMAARKAA